MIRSMAVNGMVEYLEGLLHAPHPSIRRHLRGFARDHGVEV